MENLPYTTITFANIRDTFGGRDNTNAIYLSDYMPGGMFSSNIDFSIEEEGSSHEIEILRGKGKMKIFNVQYINVSPTVVRISWQGSSYSSSKVIWLGGSSSIPYGVFTVDVPGMVPNSISGITLTPVSSTDKEGSASSTLSVRTLPSTLTNVTLTNVTTSGARVNWTGSGYTKVIVTWTGGGSSGYILSGTSFYDASGLAINSPYTFTVTPYNSINVPGTATAKSTTTLQTTQSDLYTFGSHTFTNAGVVGRLGPSLTAVRNSYSTLWHTDIANLNVVNGGVQVWRVPKTGVYSLTVEGASGGMSLYTVSNHSLGARVSGSVTLNQADLLYIVVGQKGGENKYQTGGGGGTFVFINSISFNNILFAAGGGGGSTHQKKGLDGGATSNGTGPGFGTDGLPGNGGVSTTTFAAGKNGGYCTGGDGRRTATGFNGSGGSGGCGLQLCNATSLFNGGLRDIRDSFVDSQGPEGGFGGGGAAGGGQSGGGGGGGGGGYSGGGAPNGHPSHSLAGGGGGSYASASVVASSFAVSTAKSNGRVVVAYVSA